MPRCIVTLTANAGLVLEYGDCRLWVDALHEGPVPGFSSLSPALWARLASNAALIPPDLLCFTHCHKDHFSKALTREAVALWPRAVPVLPQQEFNRQVLLSGGEVRLDIGGLTVRFLRIAHQGAAVPHYSLLISDGCFRVLIGGDGEVAAPALAGYLEGAPVDLAVLGFPWLTLRRGRRYIQEVLRPRCVLAYHLPFPEDDRNGYLAAARQAAGSLAPLDIRLLSRPFQREDIPL